MGGRVSLLNYGNFRYLHVKFQGGVVIQINIILDIVLTPHPMTGIHSTLAYFSLLIDPIKINPAPTKKLVTFHFAGCLIGILIMVYYNLYIPG